MGRFFSVLLILVFGNAVGAAEFSTYKEAAEKAFPEYVALKKTDVRLEEMDKELPDETWQRISQHPHYLELDLNADSRLDAVLLMRKGGQLEEFSEFYTVSCLSGTNAGYSCRIIETWRSVFPVWHYLDTYIPNERNWCGSAFVPGQVYAASMETYGCCFSVYGYSVEKDEFISCDVGD